MIDAELRKLVPPHVREDQVFDYDYLADYRIERAGDVQLGYHALHSGGSRYLLLAAQWRIPGLSRAWI